MKDFCLKCDFYKEKTCKSLCVDAEAWVSQDHIHQDTRLVYVGSGAKLDYLANDSTLDLAEMQTDVRLGIQEWHYVKTAGLTEQQMQVTWLYYWEKLTQTEIGKKLGIAQKNVHKHLVYAKKKLTKMLKSD